jgi:hypothetical protein
VVEEVRAHRREEEQGHPAGPYVGSCEAGAGPAPAGGKPCDGCVGNADGKAPPGQTVPGADANAGYRCDRNMGIGKGNPAHAGCPNFQLDLSSRATDGDDGPQLIAGLFCVRTVAECYVTDRTGSDAVVGAQEPGRRP